jgi:hypothetical protein
MGNLASTYSYHGQWKEAEELEVHEVQVMQMTKRVLGDEHPNTLITMQNIAFLLQFQARYTEAIALIERYF